VAAESGELAEQRQLSLSQLALLWVKDQPAVTSPIYGPRIMSHLEDAIPVLEMNLTSEDRALCDELVPPGNAVSDFHDSNNWYKGRLLAG